MQNDDLLPVTQADRDAAARWAENYIGRELSQQFCHQTRNGVNDTLPHSLAVAFARHRIESTRAAGGKGLEYHTSDEEGGTPDVGVMLRLGENEALWIGEITRAEATEYDVTDSGWHMVHHKDGGRIYVGAIHDGGAAIDLAETLARLTAPSGDDKHPEIGPGLPPLSSGEGREDVDYWNEIAQRLGHESVCEALEKLAELQDAGEGRSNGAGEDALRKHLSRMMEAAANYIEPTTYVARHPNPGGIGLCKFNTEFPEPDANHSENAKAEIRYRRDQAFIRDMIYMLDGPEQRAALSAPQGEMERLEPMNTAPKDGRYIVAVYKSLNGYAANLHGRAFIVRHEGATSSGYDLGWTLFPGHGGVPDKCLSGWLPLPAALAHKDVNANIGGTDA